MPMPDAAMALLTLSLCRISRHVLQSVQTASARPALEAIQSLKEALPFQDSATDLRKVNWQLAPAPPVTVQVAGGWALGTICRWKGRKGWAVDVLAQMPSVRPLSQNPPAALSHS